MNNNQLQNLLNQLQNAGWSVTNDRDENGSVIVKPTK